MASRNEQGRKLGPEFEVTLLKPHLSGLKVRHSLGRILAVGKVIGQFMQLGE